MRRILRSILLAPMLLLAGCLAAPLLLFEATCEVTSIALQATDPNYGSPVVEQPSVAEQAKSKCAANDAGPDTECVAYMTHLTGSY